MSNPNEQKLEVTFTPAEKGFIHARVYMSKASYTLYVDPVLQSTGLPSEDVEYQIPGGSYLNSVYTVAGASGMIRHPGMAGGLNA